ncbi:MAG: hypothetical protein ACOCTM_03315 [Bacteroidota bacterium]
MLKKAKKKVRDEMEEEENPYVEVVGEFLLDHLEENPAAAAKITEEDKSIMGSLNAMRKEAEKNKVDNCAVLTDEQGFAVVLDYFDIEEPDQEKEEEDFDVSLDDLLED